MTGFWAEGGGRLRDLVDKWGWAAVGAGLLIATSLQLIAGLRWVAAAQHADGIIVDIVAVDAFDKRRAFAPVVRFTTADGRLMQETFQQTAGYRSYYRVGQPIGVLYSAEDPADSRLDTWQSRWGKDAILPALCLLIAGMFGIGRLCHTGREAPRPPRTDRRV